MQYAGLPRTGTNSFCAALSILLDGPPYHAGVQWGLSKDESHILTMIEVIQRRPYRSESEKQEVLGKLAKRLDGYVATADPPLSLMVPELMELYPDAIVICTTRDPEPWGVSMEHIVRVSAPRLMGFLFFLLPSVRWCSTLFPLLTQIFVERYGIHIKNREDAYKTWDRHMTWLKEIVPPEKLFFADVKEGWAPLCKALDVPIPKDTPFPRLNDAKSIENEFKKLIFKGFLRWCIVFGAVGLVGYSSYLFWRA